MSDSYKNFIPSSSVSSYSKSSLNLKVASWLFRILIVLIILEFCWTNILFKTEVTVYSILLFHPI